MAEAFGEGVEPGVRDAVRASVDRLAALGAEVGEATLPHADYTLSAYYLIAPSEASSNLARYDGVRYGYRAEGADSVEMMSRTRGEGFGPEVKRRIMLGTYALSAGYYDAYYGQAQKVRTLIIRDYEKAFESFDVLVSPTSPTTAFRIGERADDPLAMYLLGRVHDPGEPRRGAGDHGPVRVGRRGASGGPPVHRPRARRAGPVPRGARARAGPRPRPPSAAPRRRLSRGRRGPRSRRRP